MCCDGDEPPTALKASLKTSKMNAKEFVANPTNHFQCVVSIALFAALLQCCRNNDVSTWLAKPMKSRGKPLIQGGGLLGTAVALSSITTLGSLCGDAH
jgi:hypothetical protein